VNDLVYWGSRGLAWWLSRTVWTASVSGTEHVPSSGGYILASNHLSMIDPLVVGAFIPRRVRFMAKSELWRTPVLRTWLDLVGAFPVRRGESDMNAIKTAIRLLEAGEVVGIFPQGTRQRADTPIEAERGVALIALRSGAPVLPAAIWGSDQAVPVGGLPWFGHVGVRYGPPVELGRARGEALKGAVDEAANRVADAIERLRPGRRRQD
jgi:1-acyl-sn-glycerol-3-phosphate acyltransferase